MNIVCVSTLGAPRLLDRGPVRFGGSGRCLGGRLLGREDPPTCFPAPAWAARTSATRFGWPRCADRARVHRSAGRGATPQTLFHRAGESAALQTDEMRSVLCEFATVVGNGKTPARAGSTG